MTELELAQAQLDAAQARVDQSMLILGALLAFQLSLTLGLVVHEAAHAAVGRWFGLQLRMIRIGRGPPLVRIRIGRAWLVLRLWPVSGQVVALASPQRRRLAMISYILGGMGGNALLLAGLGAVLAVDPISAWWTVPAGLAQLLEIVSAAVPRSWKARDGLHLSDGERLRRFLRNRDTPPVVGAQAHLTRRLGITEPAPPPSPALPEIAYQLTRPERLKEAWARRDMSRVLRDVLARADLTWLERLAVHDELVVREAQHGEGLLTAAELDRWSAEALEIAPLPALRITRAGALFRLGRLDEAEALLGASAEASGSRAAHARLVAAQIRLARVRSDLAALHEPSA